MTTLIKLRTMNDMIRVVELGTIQRNDETEVLSSFNYTSTVPDTTPCGSKIFYMHHKFLYKTM